MKIGPCGPELIWYSVNKCKINTWYQCNTDLKSYKSRFIWSSHQCQLTNVPKLENIGHGDPVIIDIWRLYDQPKRQERQLWDKRKMEKIGQLTHYTRDTYAYVCKIWSFYDQNCGQKDYPQTTMPMMPTTMILTTHDGQLHRLFGICAKYAKTETINLLPL